MQSPEQPSQYPPQQNVPPIPHPTHDYRSAPVDEQGDGTGGIIPYKNGPALTSYYLGLFSLIPCVGLVMGIAAVVLGIKGLRNAKANPVVKGTAHAWIGIVCGGFWALANIAGIIFTFFATALSSGAGR